MNLRKSVAIAFAAIAAVSSFGCGSGGNSGSRSSSANQSAVSAPQKKPLDEAEIRALLKKLESSDIAERKEVVPMEKLAGYAMRKTALLDWSGMLNDYFNRKLKYNNLAVADIKQDGDWASARISYTGSDNKKYDEKSCFRRIDGKWVFDPGEIKEVRTLKVSGYDAAELEAAANLGYTYENEPLIVFDIRSRTATKYMAGWVTPAVFVLVTDKGEYPIQNVESFAGPTGPEPISSAQVSRFCLPFKGAKGTPKFLRITGFNELDSRGLPVGVDNAQVMTFTLSE